MGIESGAHCSALKTSDLGLTFWLVSYIVEGPYTQNQSLTFQTYEQKLLTHNSLKTVFIYCSVKITVKI
mgnify:CR=1 FL=1